MLDTVFYFILNMSLASCFVIVTLLLVRQIRRLPRRLMYPLWGLAFFRLVIPFTLPTGWSLFNFTGDLVKRLVTVETMSQGIVADTGMASRSWTMMNSIGAVEQYVPVEYKTETFRKFFTTGAVVWAIVAVAAVIAALILYSLTRKKLKQAIHIKDDLYRSDMLLSPVLSGLFRPRIILPPALDPDSPEGVMIVAHEKIHKARLDNFWRLLGICITCLHWFNPFVWILLKSFLTDMELSCDEAAIGKYSKEEREKYAGTLLRYAEGNRAPVSSAFGHSGVKVRIANVLNYRKLTFIGAVASSLLLLAAAIILITNPVQ